MDDISRSLFTQLMLRLMNATSVQQKNKTDTSFVEAEMDSKTAV